MLIPVDETSEIVSCQNLLKDFFESQFKRMRKKNIGFKGGNYEGDIWVGEKIWFMSRLITQNNNPIDGRGNNTPRYWNAFGHSDDIESSSSLNISVEINIPKNGVNRRIGGLFAEDKRTKKLFLLHRGLIGGGRKNIGKEAFLTWSSSKKKKVKYSNGKIEELLLVGELGSDSFQNDLENFVSNVSKFKEAASLGLIHEASFLKPEELEKIAKARSGKKSSTVKKTKANQRDPFVSEWAKFRAKGKCQLCEKKAPFLDLLNKPYLETHHIQWLAKGGHDSVKNTVALCPNCHRKMHAINDGKDVQKLKEMSR